MKIELKTKTRLVGTTRQSGVLMAEDCCRFITRGVRERLLSLR